MKPPPRWLRRAPLIKDPLRKLAKRWAPSGPLDTVVEGARFEISPLDNKVDFDIWYKRRLEEGQERAFLADHLQKGDWFIDIGANIGLYTVSLLLAVEGLQVVAFEPLDRLRARLETNLRLNGLSERAVVRAEAVGPAGEAQLYESSNAGRSSLLAFKGARAGRTVALRPLYEVLSGLSVWPAAVKIDVEGFEADALMPYFDSAPPTQWPRAIVIETLHRAHWERDCLQELFQRGYVEMGGTDENALLVRRSV